MSNKRIRTASSKQKVIESIAAMKFWSRLRNPPPTLAFAFPESSNIVEDDLGPLHSLPAAMVDQSVVYSLRISLDATKPSVWRRVLVNETNLEVLHHIIQIVMGWDDSHLHGFDIRKTRVPLVEDGASIDERSITIAQLHAARIKKFRYLYDFGDNWKHTVVIEGVTNATSETGYPECVGGKGFTPLEDVGGIQSWSRLLDAIQHPTDERDLETTELLDRLGSEFPPPAFDLATTNARLQRAFKRRDIRRHA